MTTEGLAFPTKAQILSKLGRSDQDAQDLADTLIDLHERGEVLWDGENMVLVPSEPNA